MKPLLENKKARIRYQVVEDFSAGLELSGTEAKSLRAGRGKLEGARVIVRGGEAYLVGMDIPPFQVANAPKDYDSSRTRRLLLKKSEIARLSDAEAKKGLTIVPFEVYNNTYLKVRVAIVRGKGKEDRREDIKKRETDIEKRRVLRGKR